MHITVVDKLDSRKTEFLGKLSFLEGIVRWENLTKEHKNQKNSENWES